MGQVKIIRILFSRNVSQQDWDRFINRMPGFQFLKESTLQHGEEIPNWEELEVDEPIEMKPAAPGEQNASIVKVSVRKVK
jgi:hypothetical protein